MEEETQVRTFRDERFLEWEVRAIQPPQEARRSNLLPPHHMHGWLLFMSGEERRRLAPLPPGWHQATETQLMRWCADAEEAHPATGDGMHESR